MLWIVFGCMASALALLKLGALLVWVSVLSMALKAVAAIAVTGASAAVFWKAWKRHKPN